MGNDSSKPPIINSPKGSNSISNNQNQKKSSHQIMASAQEVFQKYDKDQSKYLEIEEIKNALQELSGDFSIKPTTEEVENIVKEIDQDNDNKLNIDEFVVMYNQIVDAGKEVREQFEFFDKDGSGKVSKDELKKSLKQLNEKLSKSELKRMMKEADLDGDGEIDFEEFKKILSAM